MSNKLSIARHAMQPPFNRQAPSRPGVPLDDDDEFPFHHESRREIAVSPEILFSYLDDHNRLSGHMSKSSWMMAGSRMDIEFDAEKGQAIGSRIRLKGRALGVPLYVEEVVTERTPPLRKAWQTVGAPRLLVIGPYRMGFEIIPKGAASQLRIFIDYALPSTRSLRWLGGILGRFYANWCAEKMAGDAAQAFATQPDSRSFTQQGQRS